MSGQRPLPQQRQQFMMMAPAAHQQRAVQGMQPAPQYDPMQQHQQSYAPVMNAPMQYDAHYQQNMYQQAAAQQQQVRMPVQQQTMMAPNQRPGTFQQVNGAPNMVDGLNYGRQHADLNIMTIGNSQQPMQQQQMYQQQQMMPSGRQSNMMQTQQAAARTLMFIVELADPNGSLVRRVSPEIRQIDWPVGMPTERINELVRQHVVQAMPESAVNPHALVVLDQMENPVTLDEFLDLGELYKVRAIPQQQAQPLHQLTMSYSPSTIATSLFGTIQYGETFNQYRGTRNNWQQVAQAAGIGQNGGTTYNQQISSIRRPHAGATIDAEELKLSEDPARHPALMTPQPQSGRGGMVHMTPAQLEKYLDQQSDSAAMGRSIKSASSASGLPITMAPSFGLQTNVRGAQQVQPNQHLQAMTTARRQNQRMPDALAVQAQMAQMQLGQHQNQSQQQEYLNQSIDCNVTQSRCEQGPEVLPGAAGTSTISARSNLQNLGQLQPFAFKRRNNQFTDQQVSKPGDDFNVNISSEDETSPNGQGPQNAQILRLMSGELDAVGASRGSVVGQTYGYMTERIATHQPQQQALYDPMTGLLVTANQSQMGYFTSHIDQQRHYSQSARQLYAQQQVQPMHYNTTGGIVLGPRPFQYPDQQYQVPAPVIQNQDAYQQLYDRIQQANANMMQRLSSNDMNNVMLEDVQQQRSLQINADRSLEGLSNIHKTESQEFEALLSARKQEKMPEPKVDKEGSIQKNKTIGSSQNSGDDKQNLQKIKSGAAQDSSKGSRKRRREGTNDGGSTQRQLPSRVDSLRVRDKLIADVVSAGFKAGFGEETKDTKPPAQTNEKPPASRERQRSQFSGDRQPQPGQQSNGDGPQHQTNDVAPTTPIQTTKRKITSRQEAKKKEDDASDISSPYMPPASQIKKEAEGSGSSHSLSTPDDKAKKRRVEDEKGAQNFFTYQPPMTAREAPVAAKSGAPKTPNATKAEIHEDNVRAVRRRVKALSSSEAEENFAAASLEDLPGAEVNDEASNTGTNSQSLKNQIKNLVGENGHEEPLAPNQNPLTPVTKPRKFQMVKNTFSFNAPVFGQIMGGDVATMAKQAAGIEDEAPKTPDQKARAHSKRRFPFNMVQQQVQAQIPSTNDEVERLHSQSFEKRAVANQCVSPAPTPRELKTVHKMMNRRREESERDTSSLSGAPAPDRLVEKTHSDISYVPPGRHGALNTFDDQKTEMGAASNYDALTSYSAYNKQPMAPSRPAEKSTSEFSSEHHGIVDHRRLSKQHRRFSVVQPSVNMFKNTFDDQKTAVNQDCDNLTSYSQYNPHPHAPDRHAEKSVSDMVSNISRGMAYPPVVRNAFDDQVTVQIQPEFSDSASNFGPCAPSRVQEMSRSEVSHISAQRIANFQSKKIPRRMQSSRVDAPLSAIGHHGYCNEPNVPIDFDAKTVMNNVRDDQSTATVLPAPARMQETSFDTNSQINLFYNNSESKKKSSGTATFVSLHPSQEVEHIPGAKSPFLRLSDERQKAIMTAAQSIGIGNTPFLQLKSTVPNSLFSRYSIVKAHEKQLNTKEKKTEEPEQKTLADFGNLVEAEQQMQEEEATIIVSPNQALNIGKPILHPDSSKRAQDKKHETLPRINTLGSGSRIQAIGSFQLNKDSVVLSQNSLRNVEESPNQANIESALARRSLETEVKNLGLNSLVINSSKHEEEAHKTVHQPFRLLYQIKSADQVAENRVQDLEEIAEGAREEDKLDAQPPQNEVNPFKFQMKTEARLCFENVFPTQEQEAHETSGRFGDKKDQQ